MLDVRGVRRLFIIFFACLVLVAAGLFAYWVLAAPVVVKGVV